MKFTDIIKELENTSPEALDANAGRRDILKNMGAKLAAAAIPFGAATLFSSKAQAKTTDILAEAIYYVLEIDSMVAAAYKAGINAPGLIPAEHVAGFQKMIADKDAHIAFWKYYLTQTGNPIPADVAYDFTGKGSLPKAFDTFKNYLVLAQAMADINVRMYLTSIQNFIGNKAFRGDAMNVATTCARHASHVRLLRRNQGSTIMPWITRMEADSLVGSVTMAYQGEDNSTQLKQYVPGINGFDISVDAATEAFDEPINPEISRKFVDKFLY